MNIFDFLKQNEIEAAPIEDGPAAFVQLVGIAQERFAERIEGLDDDNRDHWNLIEEARYGFINCVVGIAKAFQIEPFSSNEIPPLANFDTNAYRQYRADIDHYIAQIMIGSVISRSRDSVYLADGAKGSLRTHIHHIKTLIDGLEIDDRKRDLLHKKLAEFEAALGKPRLNMVALTRVVIEIMSISANALALSESATLHKMLTGLMQTVAEAKATENDQRQLPPSDAPVALIPARPSIRRESFEEDLDDEIPF